MKDVLRLAMENSEASASERIIQRIFQDTLKKYLIDREVLRTGLEVEGKRVLFVHELCECSYKHEMRHRLPDVERAQTYSARFAVGQLLEEALKSRFFDVEDHQYMKGIRIDDASYVVSGMIDIVDPDSKVPIEVKYQTTLTGVPHEHHILHLRLYLWLTNSCKGELTYTSPEGLKSFIIKNPATDDEIISLIKDIEIPRWVEWECGYCPYEPFCSKSILRRR